MRRWRRACIWGVPAPHAWSVHGTQPCSDRVSCLSRMLIMGHFHLMWLLNCNCIERHERPS